MIVNDKDAVARLLSPSNLINRMKDLSKSSKENRNNAMSLFIKPSENNLKPQPPVSQTQTQQDRDRSGIAATKVFNPFEKQTETLTVIDNTPSIEDLSRDSESKIALGLAHDSAIKLLNSSISMLSAKLDDVSASKLPAVIAAASKTVESIRKERNEQSKNSNDKAVHYHFYTPAQKQLSDYEVIEVGG